MKIRHMVSIAALAFLLTGCGMMLTEEQRANYVEERNALAVLMGMVTDEPTLAQIQATIDRIDKRLNEGEMGWGVTESLMLVLGPLIPGLGGVIASQRKRARGLVTGMFDMIDHAGGKEGKFDHSLARDLMDANPQLRAMFQKHRADQELAKGREAASAFRT